MSEVQNLFQERLHIASFVDQLPEGSNALVTGLSSSAKTMYVRGLYETSTRPVYVIVSNMLSGQKMYDDLLLQMGEGHVHLYPAEELIAAEMSVSSYDLRAERIDTMTRLANSEKGIYIIPVAGLKRKVMPKEMWEQYIFTVSVGKTLDWESVERELILAGYNRETLVNAPGQFAVRGGIIDIYPLDQAYPFRIELFDDEVDSIRTFDAESQRSLENKEQVKIGPAVELIIPDEQRHQIATGLEQDLAKRLLAMENDTYKEQLMVNIQGEIEQLREGILREQVVTYIPYLEEYLRSLVHYFDPNGTVIYDEFARIQEVDETLEREEEEWFYNLFEQLRIPQLRKVTYPLAEVAGTWTGNTVYFSLFKRSISHVSLQESVSLSCKPMQQFHGQMHLLKVEIDRWMAEDFLVYVSVQDEQRREQVLSILEDYDLVKHVVSEGATERGIVITTEQFRTGFELPIQKLALVTDQELFKMKKRPRRKAQNLTNAERIKSYSEINKGDYVVHVHHGIGRFYGVVTLEVGGVHKDYLDIRYRGDDKVYVPADQIELVQKYVPSGEKEPKLHKLGGAEWKKAKAKVTRAVKDIADELVKLYAKREAEKGFAFSPDDDMQHSFETAFPYDETDDQLRSIEEIKKDMERERPMDRLLCGDVGYGKTEVAIRAAFKAVNDGKQVAFLVPTTILAQQHYETMVERFANFPVEVGLLNRFRTKKEQEATLRDLKAGVVDVVVGTHRLLSKDVQFKDLGLLIVDEEQRFGVTHKEKIKQMRTNVDVLT
ncbi:MAG TPA: DEAD/DEAH box helicase, partial [Savagea sp.]